MLWPRLNKRTKGNTNGAFKKTLKGRREKKEIIHPIVIASKEETTSLEDGKVHTSSNAY